MLTQPLKTLKSSVWCIRNHGFQLSSFAATCLEKCLQVPVIWDTSATKALKNTSQDSSKNQQKKHCNKHRILMKMVSFLGSFFDCFCIVFCLCSDPGPTSPPKRGPDPKKVKKRYQKAEKRRPKKRHLS